MFRNMLKKAIHKSQHVQRNWDLSKTIPQEDLDLIAEAERYFFQALLYNRQKNNRSST
jgi:hypothetical protein